MIALLLTHPWAVLGAFGAAWAFYLIPGAMPIVVTVLRAAIAGLHALVKTERGRALLMLAIVAGLVWWFRTVAGPVRFADGHAAGVAEANAAGNFARAQLEAKLAGQERDAANAARDAEQKHTRALADISERFQKELDDARDDRDRAVADIRRGALQLQERWTCPASGAAEAVAGGGGPDASALLREQGAGDLVQVGAECDAQVRGLQAALAADRTVK